MAPIRVGILGLSDTKTFFGPGAWGVFAHVPSLKTLLNYEIVAVSNSTVESARRSIAANNLPASTKAYGSPEDLARDPDVDLVVVSVRVAKHYELTKPALLHNKDVYVEWPLGASRAEAEELTKLAQENGVKTMVGVQARSDRLVLKVKEILASGQIGDVVSSSVMASSSFIPGDRWMEGAEYYLDFSSGGNEFHIFFAHFLDSFTNVLGDFDDLQAILKTFTKAVPIFNTAGEVVNPAYPRTSPDHILVQGTLSSGAVASIIFRKPKSAVDNTGFRWIITGTKGEMEITTKETSWQMADPDMKLRVKVGTETEARDVDYKGHADDGLSNLEPVALNTARSYVAFAEDDRTRYATFESALKTHRLLDRIAETAKMLRWSPILVSDETGSKPQSS
ncbi:oxidoreductase family protein [Coniochaeta ligniaria NRRL 30616]|uniref:Oxidoreductase family protein n=1 Tax=Coniochaeta ligniaria NRRL 30616 TaxID=1408157 RepID=A0A1J7JGF6_9PEZI|nr:oxidoreductase family protein [Coniochaeta ligniaria NRRL 30616]